MKNNSQKQYILIKKVHQSIPKLSNIFTHETSDWRPSLPTKQIKTIQVNKIIQPPTRSKTQMEEVYKQHSNYATNFIHQHQRKTKSQGTWARHQIIQYQNKMAFINEVEHKKPLIQKYGDRYFEYLLRNRYEDECPPPSYNYQLDTNSHKLIEKDEFIKKLRTQYPSLKNRKKFVLKGKSFK